MPRLRFRLLSLMLALLSVGLHLACTARVISRPSSAVASGDDGTLYRLARTALDVEMTFELSACDVAPSRASASKQNLAVQPVRVSITPVAIPDPDAEFVVDNEALSTWLKTVESARFEMTKGMLTGVTYEAKDQARETVASGVKTLANVAKLMAPSPTALLTGMQRSMRIHQQSIEFVEARPTCSAAAREALAARSDLEGLRNALWPRWKAAVEALMKAASDDNAKIVARLDAQIQDVNTKLTVLKAARLQRTATRRIVPSIPQEQVPTNLLLLPVKLPKEALRDWVTDVNSLDTPALNAALGLQVTFTASGNPPQFKSERPWYGDDGKWRCCSAMPGIWYRNPAEATVVVARTSDGASMLTAEDVPILQLGSVYRISIENRVFQHNVHRVTFSGEGQLATFEYSEKRARALEAAGMLEDVSGGALDLQTAGLDRSTELAQKQQALLSALAQILKQQQELEKAMLAAEAAP